MVYVLAKVGNPNIGDSGSYTAIVYLDDKTGKVVEVAGERPRVGACVKVGSHYARSYQYQDWWRTSLVTEILEDRPDYMKFRTLNSVYEWRILGLEEQILGKKKEQA